MKRSVRVAAVSAAIALASGSADALLLLGLIGLTPAIRKNGRVRSRL
jgi:hypothetical protein